MSFHDAFAAALLRPDLPTPAGLSVWNGSAPSARYAVYRNNVVASLSRALADTFPVCLELVGAPFFNAMAASFVRCAPPREVTLARYGEQFSRFIASFAPAASVPYLADVARLEWLRVSAFHAARDAPVEIETMREAMADPVGFMSVCLRFRRDIGVVSSDYAIVSLWRAHRGGGSLSDVVVDKPECALIARDGEEVRVIDIDAATAEVAQGLMLGLPLARAIDQAAASQPGIDLASVLATLLINQAITSINQSDEEGKT